METLKKIKGTLIGVSVLMLILGICLIVKPQISATVICYFFGLILIIAGVARIVCYVQRIIGKFFYYYEFWQGLLDIFIAILLFLHPQNVVFAMPIIIGIIILIDSVFSLQTALVAKQWGLYNWWGILIFSILNTVFAFLLIAYPFGSSVILTVFLGISLIANSIQSIYAIVLITKYIKKNSYIDEDYNEVDD